MHFLNWYYFNSAINFFSNTVFYIFYVFLFMKLRQLTQILQELQVFENPNIYLEQVCYKLQNKASICYF